MQFLFECHELFMLRSHETLKFIHSVLQILRCNYVVYINVGPTSNTCAGY